MFLVATHNAIPDSGEICETTEAKIRELQFLYVSLYLKELSHEIGMGYLWYGWKEHYSKMSL